MAKQENQNKTRYFLIEHKECGTIIILNAADYENSYKSRLERKIHILRCPSCDAEIIEHHDLMTFFESYRKLTTNQLAKDSTMREIQLEDLEAIKVSHKPSK